nr:MAG TPA: Minor capsid protein from bacteriophage [Caudoviricetes sp.]
MPCKARLEELLAPPSLMLQQLAGTVKSEEDILGGYTAQFPFAIYYKVQAEDTNERIHATGTLNEIGRFFDAQTLQSHFPDLGENRVVSRISIESFPNLIERNENGEETYQAIYQMEYIQEG